MSRTRAARQDDTDDDWGPMGDWADEAAELSKSGSKGETTVSAAT